ATYGHFIAPSQFLNLSAMADLGLDLAQRPTGGGITFHLSDLAFSMLIPASHPGYSANTLANYAFINHLVAKAIKEFMHLSKEPLLLPIEPALSDPKAAHFCMAKPTKYDLMLDGRKVAGAAQRRTKFGFLHQGTISLALPDER